jgi:hypothetical protein
MKQRRVVVNDRMQKNYIYWPVAPAGKKFHPDFKPQLTPQQMLELGVFGGKYMTDCRQEFPAAWFRKAKLSAWTPPNRCRTGKRKAGFIRRTRVAGSSGIAAIISAGADRTTCVRSSAGKR